MDTMERYEARKVTALENIGKQLEILNLTLKYWNIKDDNIRSLAVKVDIDAQTLERIVDKMKELGRM